MVIVKKNLNKILKIASLSAALIASAGSNAAVSTFGHDAINTGLKIPHRHGGVVTNGQITFANVFVYPAQNKKWFTTIRTCFNPLIPYTDVPLDLPISASSTSNLVLPAAFSLPISGSVTPTVGSVNTANLLTGYTSPLALSNITVNFVIYNDAGTVINTLTGIAIPAHGCVTYTSDVPTDPLFGSLVSTEPGLYTVVADAPILETLPTGDDGGHVGFLFGSANSTGHSVTFDNMMKEYKAKKAQTKV
jgi:hypothetical protein